MNLEDQNLIGCNTDEKDTHIFKCHEMIRQLKDAYYFARNSAAGFTNYCKESGSTRRCEKRIREGRNDL